MKEKIRDLEIKFYEKIGIKAFRKMAIFIKNTLTYPLTIKMTKEERKEHFNSPSNYNMKMGNGLQDLKDFKKMLWLNASVHIFFGIDCIYDIVRFTIKGASIPSLMLFGLAFTINGYCIMLQRYNCLKINKVIDKHQQHEDKKKEKLKEEIKICEKELVNHECKLVENKKTKDVFIDEIIENASLKELKKIRENLLNLKDREEILKFIINREKDNTIDIEVPYRYNKTLKLEFKPKKNNESSN